MDESEFELSFKIKKEALGPYVAEQWGWEDDVQRRLHRDHWQKRDILAIQADGKDVGTVWIEQFSDHWRLGEFYVLPAFQNQGIGSHVLVAAITDAERTRLPIRLECLKWNPVRGLYERHGFRRIKESETHFFMERQIEQSEPVAAGDGRKEPPTS